MLFSDHKPRVDLGSRLELMVDSFLVDAQHHLTLQLQQPQKEEVVWQREKEWEGASCGYFSVMQDGHRIRLYYRAGLDAVAHSATCYAESLDGIHFDRPAYFRHDLCGLLPNNIIFRGSAADSFASHNFAPFLDQNPAARPEERYKAIGGYRKPDMTGRMAYAFSSWDGLEWKPMREEAVLTEGKLDSLNGAFWDPNINQYRCYSRYMDTSSGVPRRAIQSCTSPDFLNWSPVQPNTYEDLVPEFYTNATTLAPGAPHIYFSFPMRFVDKRKKLPEHPYSSLSDAFFMTSRDGVHWDRNFKEPLVWPGTSPRNWTDRCSMPAWGLVQTSAHQVSFYLKEHNRWPDARLRRYTVRRDGFASLHAGHLAGTWTSRAITFTGSRLYVNYRTTAAGYLRVELQDEKGRALAGHSLQHSRELYGDEMRAAVSWEGGEDISGLQGQTLRLHFEMMEADLFSLQFS